MVLHFSVAQWVPQLHSGVWRIQGGHLATGKVLVGIMWGHGKGIDFYHHFANVALQFCAFMWILVENLKGSLCLWIFL